MSRNIFGPPGRFRRTVGVIAAAVVASGLLASGASAQDGGDLESGRGVDSPFGLAHGELGPEQVEIGGATGSGSFGFPATGQGYQWFHTIGAMNEHWLGAYDTTGSGSLEWCVNLDSGAPTGAGTIVKNPSPSVIPGAETHKLTSAQMGYLLKNHTANDANERGALAALVHVNFEQGQGRGHAGYLYGDLITKGGGLLQKFNGLVDEARSSAAVKVVPGKPSVAPNKMSAILKDFGMKAQDGSWAPNIPFKVTLTGPGVFDNGKQVIEGKTSGNTQLKVTSTGNGNLTARYEFYPNWVGLQLQERYGTQTTLMMQPSDPEWQSGTGEDFDLIFDFQPLVSSQVGAQYLSAGDDYVDAISVVADKSYANPTWTSIDGKPVPVKAVTSVYYAGIVKPVVGADIPESAVKIGEVTTTHAGPGTQNISVPTDGKVGYYVAKTQIKKVEQGEYADYIHADATYQYGLENETSISQINPYVTTLASDKLVLPGQETSDAVSIHLGAGEVWVDGLTIKAEGTLYGPFDMPLPQSVDVPQGAPVAKTATLEFTKDNQTLDAPWTGGAVGFYTWVWSIDKNAQVNPDLFAASFTDDFMIHAETTSVRIPELSHYSLAREYNVHANGLAFDTITIGGYMPSHQQWGGDDYWVPDNLQAHVRVYDAGEQPDWSGTAVPKGTPVHWETMVEAVNGVFEIGYDDKHPITGFTPGHHYVFHYEFDGDDRVAPFTSDFNDIRERFYVPGEAPAKPTTATQAVEEVMVGENFHDTALVSGDVPEGAYLVFEAFGPQDEAETPKCEDPFFTSKKISVPGAGYYTSGDTKVTKAGVVYWVETLYNQVGEVLHKGKCGIPSETTKVIPYEPGISTKAMLNGDGTVQDQLFASWKTPEGYDATDPAVTPWPYPVGAKTTVELFYAEPGEALTCSLDQKLGEDTIDLVEGQTEYVTKKFPQGAEAGTWGFVETTRPPTTCPPEPVEPPICPPEGELPGEPGEPCEPGQPVEPEPCDPDPEPVSKGECGDPDETIIIPGEPEPLAKTGTSNLVAPVGALALASLGAVAWKTNRTRRP